MKHSTSYSGNADILDKPKVLGCYSVDAERDFGHDHSMLHFMDTKYIPENGEMKVGDAVVTFQIFL